MAHPTTPHTESGANRQFDESDLEPGVSGSTVGRGEDAATYSESEGAQTATNRGPVHAPGSGGGHGVSPHIPETVLEGSLSTRAPEGAGQGISGRSQTEESAGQEKVVNDRPDAQAGVNQSK